MCNHTTIEYARVHRGEFQLYCSQCRAWTEFFAWLAAVREREAQAARDLVDARRVIERLRRERATWETSAT